MNLAATNLAATFVTLILGGARRQVGLGVGRSLGRQPSWLLCYMLPLDHLANVPLGVILVVGLVVLLAVGAWQLRLVLTADYPALRAGEALATTVALFLLLFASAGAAPTPAASAP